MKKRFYALSLIAVMSFGMTTTVFAAENEIPVVTFTEDKEFSYGDIKLDRFEGMLPGDTETQIIEIKNEYQSTMNFFISQETIEEVRHANSASGGAFIYSLSVGTNADGSDAVSLLEKEVGGMNTSGDALEMFTGIDDLKDYTFISELDNKESAFVFLTLEIDGEGNDNQRTAEDVENENGWYGYSNFLSTLAFSFRAYDGEKVVVEDPEPTVIDRIIEVVKTNPFKGGDTSSKALYFAVIAVGVTVLVVAIAIRKKKGEKQQNEKPIS